MNWKSLTFFPESAEEKVEQEESLNVKFGIDPTRERIHLGHLVPILVARDLQRRGHTLHLILGTMTAQLGDPSGQDSTRPILNSTQVEENADSILKLCRKILDADFKVHRNHTFFEEMGLSDFLTNIASRFTTAKLLSRDGFRKREEAGNPIGLHELILPLLQGWDSVQVNADVEIGGTDQLFNFQISRELQEKFGQKPEVCIMVPIINGTDGRKMSKSFDNCIWVDEDPRDIFGKVMSLTDETTEEWIKIFMEEAPEDDHPMIRKKFLGFHLVEILFDWKTAVDSAEFFLKTIQSKQVPSDVPDIKADNIIEAIVKIRECSKTQAKRLLKQGGVKIDEVKISDENIELSSGMIIKIGKRHFGRVV